MTSKTADDRHERNTALTTKTIPATVQQQSGQDSDLVRSLKYRERQQAIQEANAQRDELLAEIGDASITAEAAKQLRQAAENLWQANEPDHHSSQEAQRLESRRRDDASASARLTALRDQLEAVEAQLRDLTRDAKREANIKLAADVWPPMVRKTMQAARDFYAALAEQAKVKQQLVDAGAWGLVDVEDLYMPSATYRDHCQAITDWLEKCVRAGFK